MVQLPHPYMTTGKTIALTRWTFVGKVMSLLFNMLSRLVITFLPRSKCLLVTWLQSPSAVILELKKIKSVTVSTVSPPICHEVMGPDAMILVFWMLSFKPTFSLSSFTFIKRLFSSSLLSAVRVVSSAYLRLLILTALTRRASVGKHTSFPACTMALKIAMDWTSSSLGGWVFSRNPSRFMKHLFSQNEVDAGAGWHLVKLWNRFCIFFKVKLLAIYMLFCSILLELQHIMSIFSYH